MSDMLHVKLDSDKIKFPDLMNINMGFSHEKWQIVWVFNPGGDDIGYDTWRCPKALGYTQLWSVYRFVFQYKPCSYRGSPMTIMIYLYDIWIT